MANLSNFTVFFNDFFDSLALKEVIDREEERIRIIQTFFTKKLQLISGAERLVRHLQKHNIPMAIATGNTKRHYSVVSRQFPDFFKSFSHVVCGWDDPEVVNKKPNPDVYFVCVNRFETKPKDLKNILIVEDSMTGITGAVATGMKTLLINDQKLCDFSAIAHKITSICDTFNDFKPENFGLPAYES